MITKQKSKGFLTFKQFLKEMAMTNRVPSSKHRDKDYIMPYSIRIRHEEQRSKIGSYLTPKGLMHVYDIGSGRYSVAHSKDEETPLAYIATEKHVSKPNAVVTLDASSFGGNRMHNAYRVIMKHLQNNGIDELHGVDHSTGAKEVWKNLSRMRGVHMHLEHPNTGEKLPANLKDFDRNYDTSVKQHHIVARLT